MPLAVCATPIGNLEDVTLRVLRELAEADLVLCEDTRHTRKLLERHGLRARLVSYHEHNEARRTGEMLPRLEAGERVALVSDAGLPGISDPGARLIAAALDAGVEVTKRFEVVRRGSVAELAEAVGEVRGEITLVVGAGQVAGPDESVGVAAVDELVAAGVPRRQAADLVSRLTGAARNRLYRGSL